ncbi:MAG: hypothetical protein DMG87_06740 [Acidobacteria bacterium]|nr:MAG: hypothetical protein DMG87_06740 [Acidobacteriota bacterium]
MDRPQEISAESFDFTDGSSINEGLQENLRRLGGFFILFMNPGKVGDAFPRVAPFGIRLGTPRRFRARVAVQNVYAVGSFTNYKFQGSAKLTLRTSLLEVGKDI